MSDRGGKRERKWRKESSGEGQGKEEVSEGKERES